MNPAKPASNKPRNLRKPKFKIKWTTICPWCDQPRRKPSDSVLMDFICDMVDRKRKVLLILPHGVKVLGKVRESKDARAAIVALMKRTSRQSA